MYFVMIDLNTIQILTKNYILSMKRSSFAMDEDPQQSSTSSIKTTTEAFKVSIYHNVNYF